MTYDMAGFKAVCACLAALFCAQALLAQSGRAELFGVVLDPSGLPVAGAAAEARERETGVSLKALTAEDGGYHFFALPPGPYDLSIAKAGFRAVVRGDVRLRVGDRVSIDFELAVGDVTETVEVRAGAPLLESARATVGQVIGERSVSSLPLDGRNFVPLIALSAGVALPPGSFFPRISGSRPRTNEYIYDGVSVLQPEPGQVAYYPVIDAIEEFRVNVNSYSAEYGRSNGGVVQVQGKAGTNTLHGALFEFLRNEDLNARNLFAQAGGRPAFRRNQYGFVTGGPLQKDRTFFLLDWQGTRLRSGVPRTSTVPTTAQRQGVFETPVYDPAATETAGGVYRRPPFPGNTIPASRFDAAAIAVAGRYPLPNVIVGGKEAAANNYRRTGKESSAQDQFDVRLDRHFGPKQRVFGRYAFLRDDSRPVTPLPDGSGDITSGVIGNTLTRADALAAEHAWIRSSSTVNQLRFGVTRRGFQRDALRTGRPASQVAGIPNLPGSAFSDALPVYQLTGYQQLGPPANANSEFTTSVTQFLDNYSTLKGRHALKTGADIRIERLDVLQPPSPSGTFQFTQVLTSGLSASGTPVANTGNPFASFLLGQVQTFSLDLQAERLKPRARIAEFFVQDDWKASSRLSLNLGVRYTLNFPSTEANDRGAVFNLQTQKLDFLGRDGFPRSARRLEKGNFGPRAGLAFRVADNLVARAGYGLIWIEQAGITTPFTTPSFPFLQTVTQRSMDNVSPAFVLSSGPSLAIAAPNADSGLGQGVFSADRGNGSGYAQQWNLTLQTTARANWSFETGYLGSKITRLGVPDTNLNQLPVSALSQGALLTQQVPNPFYGQIPAGSSLSSPTIARQQLLRLYPRFTTVTLYRNNVGNSTYHALATRVERRFSRGATFTASYTFSKLIDDASSVFDAAILTGPVANFPVADSFNRRLEKDVSNGDIPHAFTASFVYELPFGRGRSRALAGWREWVGGGWGVAGIVRAQSGIPVAVSQATNFNSFAGFGAQRPFRVGNPELPADQRATSRYFNTAAFAAAPQFALGDSSRNPVRGPGYQTLDVAVSKTFAVSERWRAEFRAEAFNSLNTPPLGNPNGTFGSAAFGTITTAGDPRTFEMVLKLKF